MNVVMSLVLDRTLVKGTFVILLTLTIFIGRSRCWHFKWKLLTQSVVSENMRSMSVGATFIAFDALLD